MFGCASLPGTDPEALAVPLSYLHHHHLAPPELRAARAARALCRDGPAAARRATTRRARWRELPPLIKGYLRLGGFVGDGAVIDQQFNTTDVCIVVKTDRGDREILSPLRAPDATNAGVTCDADRRGRRARTAAADARIGSLSRPDRSRADAGAGASLLLRQEPGSRAACRAGYHRLCCRMLGIRLEMVGAASRSTRPDALRRQPYRPISTSRSSARRHRRLVHRQGGGRALAVVRQAGQAAAHGLHRPPPAARRRAIATRSSRRLDEGDNLIMFPEGTSSDGIHVLPFKSALFERRRVSPRRRAVVVQPVSVAYIRLDGIPLGRFYRPLFAWYGEMDLAPHLWTMLGLGRLDGRGRRFIRR